MTRAQQTNALKRLSNRLRRYRWAAAKLRNLLSRNSTLAPTHQNFLTEKEVTAIVHAIRTLEGRTP